MTLIESENKAAAWIDDGGDLRIAGRLTVNSFAEALPRTSAVARTDGAASGTAIGGAVVWAVLSNQATSFLGYNVIVDVAGVLSLTSAATIASPYDVFDPTLALGDLGDSAADVNTASERVASALEALTVFLAPHLADPAKIGTSYVHAAAGGAETSLSGGVNYIEIYNLSGAGIAPGAKVNKRGLAAGADQDVVLNADVHGRGLAGRGLESVLATPAGTPTAADTAGGGYFNGLFVDNHARAYIDDRAVVKAARNISLDALIVTNVLSVAKQGATATGLTISGAFGVVRSTTRRSRSSRTAPRSSPAGTSPSTPGTRTWSSTSWAPTRSAVATSWVSPSHSRSSPRPTRSRTGQPRTSRRPRSTSPKAAASARSSVTTTARWARLAPVGRSASSRPAATSP